MSRQKSIHVIKLLIMHSAFAHFIRRFLFFPQFITRHSRLKQQTFILRLEFIQSWRHYSFRQSFIPCLLTSAFFLHPLNFINSNFYLKVLISELTEWRLKKAEGLINYRNSFQPLIQFLASVISVWFIAAMNPNFNQWNKARNELIELKWNKQPWAASCRLIN